MRIPHRKCCSWRLEAGAAVSNHQHTDLRACAQRARSHTALAAYVTTRSFRDLNCGLAGETTFNGNLGTFSGPVIMFAAGHGFGTAMQDTAALMTSATVTMKSNPIMKWIKDNF